VPQEQKPILMIQKIEKSPADLKVANIYSYRNAGRKTIAAARR
jgi:hypothetical protein